MQSINDDLFNSFKENEIDNLDAIKIRGGNNAISTGRWTLYDSLNPGIFIDCKSDSSVNGDRVAGYSCLCIDVDAGTSKPC